MPRPTIGKLKPAHSLLLNPHAETRLSRCPDCNRQTFLRKFALLVHAEGWGLFAQGKTCKYCARCKMIFVQQDELEAELAHSAQEHCPAALGQEYFLIGMVEPKTFKGGLTGAPGSLEDMLEHTSDFRQQYGLAFSPGGWYPAGKEPPVLTSRREQRIPRTAPR
jgi:hypothetical protein